MSREGNSTNNVNALIAEMERARVGTAEAAVTHEPSGRVRKLHIPGSLKEGTRKQQFILAKPAFIPLSFAPVSVEYKRFPRTSLVNTKHKTAKLRALNIKRRRVMLGLKKKTVRKPAHAPARKSTRRKSTK